MKTIKEHKEAEKELITIKKAQDEFNNNSNKSIREIQNKYWDLKRELEDKEYREIQKLSKEAEEINEKYEANKENFIQIETEYKKIVEFIKIWKEKNNLEDIKVYKYDYINNDYSNKVKIYYNVKKVLISDEFKHINLYITENRKPLNKYSLVALGNTIFNDKLFNAKFYFYGLDCLDDGVNIRIGIKDFKTEKEAEEYINRNEKRILKDFLEEHREIETEYKEILKEVLEVGDYTKTLKREWEIAYLEDLKYYYENNYSHGEETEEYKEIIKKLKELGL